MLLECEHCSATVDACVLVAYDGADYIEGLPDYTVPARYSFLKCPVCESPMLTCQLGDFDADTDDLVWAPATRIYPGPFKRISATVPVTIRRTFEEALNCLKARAFTACLIMCRKTVEVFCVEHDAKRASLAKSLERMRDQGLLDARLFEWAEQLRLTGNDAAHDVILTLERRDALDAIEFTHALLEYTYTFRERFRVFTERRKKQQADGADSDASDS